MHYRTATLDDVPLLAELNRQLVEDEGHRNQARGLPWFEQRMRQFLTVKYTALIFEERGRPVAYALFCDKEDSVHLRQFLVCRDCRRQGHGREAMRILVEQVWPRDKRLTVGVLCRNKVGYAFWKAMGFEDYSVELEMPPPGRIAHPRR